MSIPSIIKRLAENIQIRKKTGHRLYHLLLAHQQEAYSSPEGYMALARLVKEGFFSAILTINSGRMLEEALEALGYSPPQYETLIVGRDTSERIIDALEGECAHICIIKFLTTDQQGASFSAQISPDLAALATGLEHYLNEDIIIVGSIEQEKALIAALLSQQRGNSTYYVLPHESSLTAEELKTMSKRGKPPTLIPDPYSEFDFFFKALASLLVPGFSFNPPVPGLRYQLAPQPPGATFTAPTSSSAAPSSHAPNTSKQQGSSGAALSPPVSSEPRDVSASIKKKTRADVLLVTANDIETRAVLALCTQPIKPSSGQRTYHDLGVIGGTRVFLVQCPQLGSYRPGGSRDTVEKGIQDLTPWAVIMVGVAFGFKPHEQHIGDILISQEIQDYDLERIGRTADNQRKSIPRGPRLPASVRLLSAFKAHRFHLPPDWGNPPQVHFGLILTGSKLVDNEDFRNQLLGIAPEAIGGEMEAMGMHDAATEKHIDWILIKAICDWADGNKNRNKDDNQKLAAENAARFVLHVIGQGEFSRSGRRRRESR